MPDLNLHDALNKIDISADWVGLREVKETTTYRVVRDGNPQANMQDLNQGIMIEVLADGQFGYYGSRKMDIDSIQYGAEKAVMQAKAAAKNPIFNFKIDVFKGVSGQSESERLDLPLLGQIGLDPKLSECCDNGTPYVLKYKNTLVKKEFEKISNFITSQNKK